MRFREVERNIEREKLTNKNEEKEYGFMQIKSERMTYEEATAFLDELFRNMREN